jgi:subtilisin family serine protease
MRAVLRRLAAPAVLAACMLIEPGAAAWAQAPVAADQAQGPGPGDPQDPSAPRQVMVMLSMSPPHFRADASYGAGYRRDAGREGRKRIAIELARTRGLSVVSGWPMPLLGVDCYVLEVPSSANVEAIVADLARDRRVEWAQPVNSFRTLGAGDPMLPAQPAASGWHLTDLHRIATGRQVSVAVIDSGIDSSHPELDGQVSVIENFVESSPYAAEAHGTAVAGIIAARADNGIGIRGVAPNARVLALRACREGAQGARCDSFSLGKALVAAIGYQPQVINMSLSGPPDRLLQRLLDRALARGIVVVGAADPQQSNGGFPASWPGVVAVSSGSAPGRDIPTTLPGNRFGVVSGVSYASAHVSGLAALLGELGPRAAPKGQRALLARAAQPPGSVAIDACATVGQAAGTCVCTCPLGASARLLHQP